MRACLDASGVWVDWWQGTFRGAAGALGLGEGRSGLHGPLVFPAPPLGVSPMAGYSPASMPYVATESDPAFRHLCRNRYLLIMILGQLQYSRRFNIRLSLPHTLVRCLPLPPLSTLSRGRADVDTPTPATYADRPGQKLFSPQLRPAPMLRSAELRTHLP